MKNINQDEYIRAWNYASIAHKDQTLPGRNISYLNHIGLVTFESMSAILHASVGDPDLLIVCSILHDTIEDTETTFQDIRELFGQKVADGVWALTKDKLLSTKTEQMIDSVGKIKSQPKEIWMVKLADRITNLQPPPAHWPKEKIKNYREEASFILQELGEANHYLKNRLQKKIENYSKFAE